MSDETWEAKGPDAFGDFTIASKGEELAKCVVVQNGFRTPEETAAIAARLIKAVNSHEALVKALTDVVAWFDSPDFIPKVNGVQALRPITIGPVTQGVFDRARSAVSQLKS